MSEAVQVPCELKADLRQAWVLLMGCLLQNCNPPYGNPLSLYQKVTGNKKKKWKWGRERGEGKKRLNNTMAKTKSSN